MEEEVMNDYTCALNDVLLENWDNLFMLMMRTTDDFLRKKIELLLVHIEKTVHPHLIRKSYDSLLSYIYHAQNQQIILV